MRGPRIARTAGNSVNALGVSGSNVFAGYWRMPEKTVEAWRNLWFHTGDALRKDAEGWFYFVDRYKDALADTAGTPAPGTAMLWTAISWNIHGGDSSGERGRRPHRGDGEACAGERGRTVRPLTVTRPALISSSAPRREATPARAR